MLSHLRVIDLTTGSEQIGGQILGDLGADVILVEPPRSRLWAEQRVRPSRVAGPERRRGDRAGSRRGTGVAGRRHRILSAFG